MPWSSGVVCKRGGILELWGREVYSFVRIARTTSYVPASFVVAVKKITRGFLAKTYYLANSFACITPITAAMMMMRTMMTTTRSDFLLTTRSRLRICKHYIRKHVNRDVERESRVDVHRGDRGAISSITHICKKIYAILYSGDYRVFRMRRACLYACVFVWVRMYYSRPEISLFMKVQAGTVVWLKID